MKSLAITAVLLPLLLSAFECEVQIDNEHVYVTRLYIAPHEQIGPHRSDYARILVGLQGGSLIRTYQDGTQETISVPTNEAVFLEADPVGVVHYGVNPSDLPIEVISIALKK